jgi:hypothetical protein
VTAIRELIEAVEQGREPSADEWRAIFPDLPDDDDYHRADMAFAANQGWLSAAFALMEVEMPGVPVALHDMTPEYLGRRGWVAKVNWPHVVWQPTFTAAGQFAHEGRSDLHSRAVLLAILKAMEARG